MNYTKRFVQCMDTELKFVSCMNTKLYERRHEKTCFFCICKNKGADQPSSVVVQPGLCQPGRKPQTGFLVHVSSGVSVQV